MSTSGALRLGDLRLSWRPTRSYGVFLEARGAQSGEGPSCADPLHEVLLAPASRAEFFSLVERFGLVVWREANAAHPSYREVRGRSSRGRLSQGEYYHHDGCAGPQKPRVVEIRCPQQPHARRVGTSIAPFSGVVRAMLGEAEGLDLSRLEGAAARRLRAYMAAPPSDPSEWDEAQALVTRTLRRALSAAQAREFFARVDARAGAYVEPWTLSESRFIANAPASADLAHSAQHRRATPPSLPSGESLGHLLKRWPAEALDPECAALSCEEDD